MWYAYNTAVSSHVLQMIIIIIFIFFVCVHNNEQL